MDLSFAISSGCRPDLRSRLVNSIKQQDYGGRIEILIGQAVPVDQLSTERNRLYRLARSPWVYFMDEDCELPDVQFVTRLFYLLKDSQSGWGGGYLDRGLSSWSKSYNALVNFWLTLHHKNGQPLPVAGNVLLPKILDVGDDFPFCQASPFGGEEIALCRNMAARSIPFSFNYELSVVHNVRKSRADFFSRAWQHGRAERQKISLSKAFTHLVHEIHHQYGWTTGLRMFLYLGLVWTARWI